MPLTLLRITPVLIAAAIASAAIFLEFTPRDRKAFEMLQRIEWATFDWRVRLTSRFDRKIADRLAIVLITDQTLKAVESKLGHRWPFPRWIHGMVLKELGNRGATSAAYDIFFIQTSDEAAPSKSRPVPGSSDRFFAQEIERFGGVFLGVPQGRDGERTQMPAPLFLNAAAGSGHAVRISDGDGIIRRVLPYIDDPEGGRIWQLGFVLAARRLGADLNQAQVGDDFISLMDKDGAEHRIPLDGEGYFLIRWLHTDGNSLRFPTESIESVLGSASVRSRTFETEKTWPDYHLIIGSSGVDPSIADRGPTAASRNMPFFLVHLDVANSILTNSFVKKPSPWVRIALLVSMAAIASLISWRLRIRVKLRGRGCVRPTRLGSAFPGSRSVPDDEAPSRASVPAITLAVLEETFSASRHFRPI